jgi:hypothetical protein
MGPLVIVLILFCMSYVPLHWSATKALQRNIGPEFLISYLTPLVLGLVLPWAPVFLAIVLVLFLATTRDRLDAACRFVLLALLLPQIIWRLHIGAMYLFDLNTIHILAIGLLIQCALKPDRKAAPISQWTIEDTFVTLLFAIIWIGGERMPSISLFLREGLSQTLMLLLPYFALRRSLRSSEEFMRVTACFAVASGILALFAIYEAVNGWTLFGMYRHVSDAGGMNKSLIQRGGALRAPVTMSSALMLGVVLLSGLTATFYSRRYVRQTWMILGWGAVTFLGLVVTQSRGNLALLPIAGLIFCLLRKKYGLAALIGVGAPAALAILLAAAQMIPQIGAFLNVGSQAASSRLTADVYDYRQLLLNRGLEVGAMNRWTGASLDYVVGQLADISQGQGIVDMVNTYLTLYLISGLAGFLPFLAILAIIWWKLITARTSRLGNPELSDMRGFALTALAVVTVQLAFMSFIDRLPLCLFIALVGARIVAIERGRLQRIPRKAGRPEALDPPPPAPPAARPIRPPRRRPGGPNPSPAPSRG